MDTLSPLSSIPPVSASSPRNQGQQPGQNFPGQGQLLKAFVLQAKSDSQFVLEIDGNRLTARSDARLTVGQTLQLQVTKSSLPIELKIVSDTLNQFIGKSITLIGKNIDIKGLFSGLQSHTPSLLNSLSPTSKSIVEHFYSLQQSGVGGDQGGQILKNLIQNLGLNFEQLLLKGDKQNAANTLKAALLEIAQNFSSAERLAETTHKLLTTLELFQFAQLHRSSDTHIIFPIPLPFVEQGYIVVERGNKDEENGQGGEGENRFSLHLTMSEIGNLRIDFLQTETNLSIKLMAETQEKADFMEMFKEELQESITGTSQINIVITGDAPDPIADLIREMVPEGSSVLDTRV